MTNDIEYLTSLEKIILAYEEIAAKRLQKVKDRVLQNRIFLTELNQIFQIVRYSYQKEVAKYKFQTLNPKKGKIALVFLAANAGLYGDLIQRIFQIFLADLKQTQAKAEIVIVGQIGKNLININRPKLKFTYFDFPDAKFDKLAAKKLLNFLAAYEKVIVYHGSFKNILMQQTNTTDITGTNLLPKVEPTESRRLIFEPSLGQVLEFFETEVFASLLIQTLSETQLAKFSARMTSLDEASEKIKEAIQQTQWQKRREEHRLSNKRQLEALAGRIRFVN